jgi:hypothetical protein
VPVVAGSQDFWDLFLEKFSPFRTKLRRVARVQNEGTNHLLNGFIRDPSQPTPGDTNSPRPESMQTAYHAGQILRLYVLTLVRDLSVFGRFE